MKVISNTIIMEGKPSPHLKKVLKSYKLSAANTLSGPSSLLSRLENNSSNSSTNGPNTNANNNSSNNINSNVSNAVGGNNSLIMKSNYSDPNGMILEKVHGASTNSMKVREETPMLREIKVERMDRDDLQYQQHESISRLDRERQQQHQQQRITNNKGFTRTLSSSESSSTTSSGSTSTSPVSNYNGYDISPRAVRDRSPDEVIAVAALTSANREFIIKKEGAGVGSGSCSGGSAVPPHPKKLMHRRNLNLNESQRIQAAITLASGMQLQNYPPSLVLQPPPILSAPDRATTEKRETPLEGEYISCFVVGGEKRLCFPQILTTVLRPFLLPQINQVCDELQIFCSRCSAEQLEVLKVTGVLPMNANSCGLITKTDAERLVNALLHRNPPKAAVGSVAARAGVAASSPQISFRVYHECFGKCKGIVLVNMYDKPDSLCIECVECHGLFSPSRFVAHAHHRQEVRTCHWGFDSAKWRNYLMLAREEDREKWEKVLSDFKGKFDHKRKESLSSDESLVIKRVRYSGDALRSPVTTSAALDPALYLPSKKRLPFIQYSDNDQTNVNAVEVDSVKKMLLARLGGDGADTVIRLLDRMTNEISYYKQICRNQDKQLRRGTDSQPGTELQAKVSTMEAELHSLKKQLLRRHEQHEVI